MIISFILFYFILFLIFIYLQKLQIELVQGNTCILHALVSLGISILNWLNLLFKVSANIFCSHVQVEILKK